MTFQWALAAGMMYVEAGIAFILCIPFISNTTWQKFFRLSLLQQIGSFCRVGFYCAVVFQLILFFDSTQTTMKLQAQLDQHNKEMAMHPAGAHDLHLKMFRSQRNCYISGCALGLLIIIYRLHKLISCSAVLSMSNEAFKRQAENASKTAEQFMAECERLKLSRAMEQQQTKGDNSKVATQDTSPLDGDNDDDDDEYCEEKMPNAGEPERFGDLSEKKRELKQRAGTGANGGEGKATGDTNDTDSSMGKKDD